MSILNIADLRNLEAPAWANHRSFPPQGSEDEKSAFRQLQAELMPQFERIFPDPRAARTVLVVPSLSMDREVLGRISGVHHYEERLLFMLMLLRLPRARLVYVTSTPIDPTIVDYYLNLLPGVPNTHARRRLTLISCHDASAEPLTKKILDRPRIIERIARSVPDLAVAHMTCFNATALERTLSVRLGIPLYACDPDLTHHGSKSGSRKAFRRAGILFPPGSEDLRDEHDITEAIVRLKRSNPSLERVVVKLDEGFSGEGNACFPLGGAPADSTLNQWVLDQLPQRLTFEATGETWEHYLDKFREMGGIVESWIVGDNKRSPSVQCRLSPIGAPEVISTHDQVLGGPSGQIFLGSSFPADAAYRMDIQAAGLAVGGILKDEGVLGRFGIDFISVVEDGRWKHYAIEINLRKGGTTHTFLMMQLLTDGSFTADNGTYMTPTGRERYYYASDNLESEYYRGLTPDDLIDIAVDHNLHFHAATSQGVVFHLIGALSEFGKLGVLCIASTADRAHQLYAETVKVLDHETRDYKSESAMVDIPAL